MYQVWIRQAWSGAETLIHSSQVNDLKLASPTITLDVSSIDAFAFDIYPGNPGYNELTYLATLIRVYNTRTKRNLFEGRILNYDEQLDDDGSLYKEVTCEALEAVLHDSVQPFTEFTNKSKSDILNSLISAHNAQVDAWKQIKIGNIDFGANSTQAYVYTDDSADTYDNMSALIMSGYEYQLRHADDGLYIDVAQSLGGTGKQTIAIARNIITASLAVDPSDFYTVIKPLGDAAETTDDSTDTTDKGTARLTISSVNNGSPYLKDSDLVSEFGTIIKAVSYDGVTDANALKTQGQATLNAQEVATRQLQLGVIDLNLIDGQQDDLRKGYTYPVKITPIGITDNWRIAQMSIDLVTPSNNTVTFGNRVVGQEAYNTGIQAELKAQIKLLQAKVVQVQSIAGDASNLVNSSRTTVSVALTKAADLGFTYKVTSSGATPGTFTVQVSADNATWSTLSSTNGTGSYTASTYGTYYVRARGVFGNYYTDYSSSTSLQLSAPTSTGIGDSSGVIIDVSEFQSAINWSSVVAGGLSLAVIRVQSGYTYADKTYTTNIPNAIAAGANYAVYAYFAALDSDDAKDEAKTFISRAQGAIGSSRAPRFYMVDVEEISVTSGTMRDAVSAYMDQLNALGIPDSQIVLYIANQLYSTFNLDTSRAAGIWLPSYGTNDGTVSGSTKPTHAYDLWQYTSKGSVSGISGDVDMSTDASARMKTLINNK
ncbi:GH25 family lysozyme [Lacticaseibacillus pantheris]|uniref:GH25 family lysozyme n=1 Tax=Lacticaseibacillus pantheris TaxID=171523 RepID=UPI00265946B5|nr:GH25 family lysozyme [Lacticaseibacillus pantheris]WKF86029.1 GH25 family lysozyme [Lacticaseibacillus pantheris]